MAIRIEDWSVVVDINNRPHLSGKMYGHPTIKDGVVAVTSPVIDGDVSKKLIYTQSGSEYELGISNKEFEKMFPHPEERMWASLKLAKAVDNAQNN